MTVLLLPQLYALFLHLWIPEHMTYDQRYKFTGEECLMYYLFLIELEKQKCG